MVLIWHILSVSNISENKAIVKVFKLAVVHVEGFVMIIPFEEEESSRSNQSRL